MGSIIDFDGEDRGPKPTLAELAKKAPKTKMGTFAALVASVLPQDTEIGSPHRDYYVSMRNHPPLVIESIEGNNQTLLIQLEKTSNKTLLSKIKKAGFELHDSIMRDQIGSVIVARAYFAVNMNDDSYDRFVKLLVDEHSQSIIDNAAEQTKKIFDAATEELDILKKLAKGTKAESVDTALTKAEQGLRRSVRNVGAEHATSV